MEYYLSGGIVRGSQILIDASIWIAFGCFIAAIFRKMLGPEKTCLLFGNDSRFGLLIGWGVGMLLPVCSLGVIPVVRELHRAGVKPGTIISFGLTAPLFNPLSILYGLSLSDPLPLIFFSAAAMVIVTGLGASWGKLFYRGDADSADRSADQESVSSSGVRRSLSVIFAASTEMVSWSLVFIVIGIAASATTAVLFAHGSLQGETEPDKVFAPVFMAFYVTPVYSTPLLAMSQIGGMFQHGNSVGAAFSLLILGAGVNAGLLCWFGFAFGFRRFLAFLFLLFVMTIGLAYAMDKPLYPKGVTPSGHTHAFDVYTHPFQNSGGEKLYDRAFAEVRQHLDKNGSSGVTLLGILAIGGICLRLIGTWWDLPGWLQKGSQSSSRWEIALPAWVIGIVACLGLIAVSVLGTYLYYPNPDLLLDDLSSINGNCVVAAKTGDWEGVEKWVLYCDDLSRRLEVGVFLRTGGVSEFQRAKAKVYRKKLDELRDDIAAGLTARTDEQAMELYRAFLQLRKAFR